ncbi:g-type lectin s-receptor-like serine/threonine-protein kinase lecrk3 [Quercus suber]|uniref:G-type lectin s-receptor-like serine/threonine-protein kinase lecrk3 n=1 Tax=Quercus suber TaxID=58331 RepID=A0AAW0LBI6_QUESU
MATTFLFLLLSAIFIAKAQQGQSNVNPGSFLTPTTNSSWPSPSGQYAFGFYKQGNGYAVGVFFAGIPEKTVVWTANRDDPPVPAAVTLNFTSAGRLVLQSAQGTTKSVVVLGETASSASMLDTGNFVVYNSDNQSIWESFQNPTDTLLPTQQLFYDDVLDSSVSESNQSTGRFRAIMQQDGFIALYPIGTPYYIEYGYWSKGIQGPQLNATLNLDVDGHLYLANGNGIVTISAGGNSTKGLLYRLRMDDDGFLRLYSYNTNQNGDWVVTWSAIVKCDPKGLCGVNAFCVIYDEEYNCTCLPGFAFVDESKRTLGCERNLTVDNCKEGTYVMEEEIDTVWENDTYSLPLFSSNIEDCKIACLQDCNWEAALFKDGACRKQRLPMRFGRRQSDSSVALIKVSTSTPSTNRTMTKERNKELRVDILIVSITLVAFAFTVLAISAFVIYRSHVSKHENVSNMGNFVDEDVGPRSFTYAELEKMTDVLLEIIFCRRSVDSNLPEEEVILEEWVYSCFECGELDKLINDEEVDKRQFERMVKVAFWCILEEPSLRPSMKKVLIMLEGTADIPIPPNPTSVISMI